MFIYRRGRTWFFEWNEGPKRKSKAIHKYLGLRFPITGKSEAQMFLAKLKFEEGRIALGQPDPNLTIKDILQNWLRATERFKTRSTIQTDIARVKYFLKWCEENRIFLLAQVTQQILRDFLDYAGRTAKTSTLNRYSRTVIAALNWAKKEGTIQASPLQNFRLYPEKKERVKQVIRPEDLQRLFDSPPPFSDLIKISYYTLLRRSEVCYLTWEDIDLKKNTLIVQAKEGFSPKGGRFKTVPLNSLALKTLRSLKPQKSGRLFPQWSPGRISHKWIKLAKQLRIKARFHDLRHTAASYLAEKGVSVKAIQELLGHSTPDLALEVYIHANQSHLKEAVNRL